MKTVVEGIQLNHGLKLTEFETRWFMLVREKIEKGKLDPATAKALFKNRFLLTITDKARRLVLDSLVKEYGIRHDWHEEQRDIAVCVDLDDAGVIPSIATRDYYLTHWRQDLNPHVDSEYKGLGRFNFPLFVKACKASSGIKKIQDFLQEGDMDESVYAKLNPLPFIKVEDQKYILKWFRRFKTTSEIHTAYDLSERTRQRLSATSDPFSIVNDLVLDTILAPKNQKK